MDGKKRRTRTRCKIDDLPEQMKQTFLGMLADTKITYVHISEFLKEQGYNISKSAVGNYALKTNDAMKRLQEAQEQTKALVEVIKNNPQNDYTEALVQILASQLTTQLANMQEEWEDVAPDKIGRLAVQLSRSATYKEKAKEDMKTKAEIAFKKMETEILKTIMADEGQAKALHKILSAAKEKMIKDEH